LISTHNKGEFSIIKLNEQRKSFVKLLKQLNCLVEEIATSEDLGQDSVVIKDKKYIEWKLFEGIFFPLDSANLQIPSLAFKFLTYSTAKFKSESVERKSIEKFLYTKPLKIKVKPLPGKWGKELPPVGYFNLSEAIGSHKFYTGKSFKYTFRIVGEGNISNIPNPTVLSNENFDIYSPKISQEIYRQQGRITGVKTFVYYVTPKEPGEFKLGDYFKWPYFNTAFKRFDTLSSTLSLKVRGESLKNNYISVNNPGDFYNKFNTESNRLMPIVKKDNEKIWINISLLLMLLVVAFIVFKK
jgi:hypothetical protein